MGWGWSKADELSFSVVEFVVSVGPLQVGAGAQLGGWS